MRGQERKRERRGDQESSWKRWLSDRGKKMLGGAGREPSLWVGAIMGRGQGVKCGRSHGFGVTLVPGLRPDKDLW